jgi:hypothetical protein
VHSFNRYAYANNNPYKYTDPDGKLPILVPLIIFAAKEIAAEAASQATGGATDFLSTRRMAKKGLNLTIKMKKNWDAGQRTEAIQKVEALNKAAQNGDLSVVKKPQCSSTGARSRYESQNGKGSVGQGNDADHTIELQLGGSDTVGNLAPLNSSVNRSVGAQIQQQIKNKPAGTKVCSVKVCDG